MASGNNTDKPIASGNRMGRSFRVLRPLLWWLILVLVLYGIRTNQRLLEQTRLYFDVTLHGLPVAATVMLDGIPASNGQKISLGNHTVTVRQPNCDLYSTNLFVWYGALNLNVKLDRSMGTLSVQATPAASTITIMGPEFSTNVYDSGGVVLTVPTDQYVVRAEYPHSSEAQNPTVMSKRITPCVFSPRFGALGLSCNKTGAAYRLESADGQITDGGSLPATVADLPAGTYQVTVSYHHRELQESDSVTTGTTNDFHFQFTLGAVRFETAPSGADVRTVDGDYLGRTPLVVADLTPQTTQFKISLAGYEPVSMNLDIVANQTNSYSTNLMSIGYLSAMNDARNDMAVSNFSAVVQAAAAALIAKPNDAHALALQNEANNLLKNERERLGRLARPRQVFENLCEQHQDADLFGEHELNTDKQAKNVATAIISSLKSGLGAFEIEQDDSPKPGIYEIVGRETFSLGVLGGTETDALIVVGQAKDDQAQVWFKSLEYQIQHSVTLNSLTSVKDIKRLVAVSPRRMQMNSVLEEQVRLGEQSVTQRVQQGIDQALTAVQQKAPAS